MRYKVKKIGLWMLTALFFLFAVYTLAQGNVLGGMLFAILTMFVSPLRGKIFERFKWPDLKGVTTFLIAFVLFIGAFISMAANVDNSVNTINQLNEQVKEISLEKDSLYTTIDDLNNKVNSFDEQYQSKQTEYETSLTQKDTIIKEQEEQISQLKGQLNSFSDYQSQVDTLTSENNSLKDKVDQLQQQIASSQKTTTSQNSTSITSSSSISDESSASADDITVYITKTGDKYHLSGCRYLKKSKISIMKNDAVKQGYGACSVCKP